MVYEDPHRNKSGDAWKWQTELGSIAHDGPDDKNPVPTGRRSGGLAFLIVLAVIVLVVVAIIVLPQILGDSG